MTLPKTIRIGSLIYGVKEVSHFEGLENTLGVCSYNQEELLVKDSLSPRVKEKVLTHEIIHALLDAGGMLHDERNEEICMRLESPFYSFLKENTSLFEEHITVQMPEITVSPNSDEIAKDIAGSVFDRIKKIEPIPIVFTEPDPRPMAVVYLETIRETLETEDIGRMADKLWELVKEGCNEKDEMIEMYATSLQEELNRDSVSIIELHAKVSHWIISQKQRGSVHFAGIPEKSEEPRTEYKLFLKQVPIGAGTWEDVEYKTCDPEEATMVFREVETIASKLTSIDIRKVREIEGLMLRTKDIHTSRALGNLLRRYKNGHFTMEKLGRFAESLWRQANRHQIRTEGRD